MIDILALRAALRFDPVSGEFFWIANRANKKVGDIAGNLGPNGYRTIMVDYHSYYAHHLAFVFMTGQFPSGGHIDHINGIKSDNRFDNLRLVSPSINGLNRKQPNKNNKSGVSGVWQTKSGKFCAFIDIQRKRHRLGTFETFEEACRVRRSALETQVGIGS